MRLKLRIKKEHIKTVEDELVTAGIEISENARFILTEEDFNEEQIFCKDGKERVAVLFSEICCIESFGHDVFVYTMHQKYKTDIRIYQFQKILPEEDFVRISNSVIIQRNAIQRIKPALSSKFYLTLINGMHVDVTRTYYFGFKDFYGI